MDSFQEFLSDEAVVRRLAIESLSAETRQWYERVVCDYEDTVGRRGMAPWPASSATLAAFTRELVERQRQAGAGGHPPVSTVRRSMSALHAVHRFSDWAWPWSPLLSAAALGAEKSANAARAQHPELRAAALDERRAPFDVDAVVHAAEWFVENESGLQPRDKRMWSLYLAVVFVGLRLMLRGKSLCLLDVGDVRLRDDSVQVYLAQSKTDRTGAGTWLAFEAGESTRSAARWLRGWLDTRADISRLVTTGSENALFLWPVGARGRPGVVAYWRRLVTADVTTAVREVYRRAGRDAGDVARVSAHSLRAGGATRLYEMGAPEYAIRGIAGWASADSMRPYVAVARSPHGAQMFEQ